MVADRSCDLLHVTWHATNGGSCSHLFYQAFDTSTLTWVGQPDQLLTGTASTNQFYPNDISVTTGGTIGITYNTNSTPTMSGLAPWSGGIMVKRRGDAAFQGPYRCNTDTYGMLASAQAIGEVFHMSFRTNGGLYGIRYRAFDATTLQYVTASDVPLYGTNQANMRSTNSSHIATDDAGNLYILYSVGSPNPAGGALEVAFASPSNNYSTWTISLVESDPSLTAGNTTFQHYTLARAENGAVYAVFARASENYQNLYARILTPGPSGGAVVIPDPATTPGVPLLTSSEDDTFKQVDGLRAEAVHSGPMVVFSGTPTSRAAGYVDFMRLASAARTVEWGLACQGNLPQLPRLASDTVPQTGTNFSFRITDAPTNTPGVVFAGFDCLVPPFDLGVLGMPDCAVFLTPLSSNLAVTDPSGNAALQLAIPPGFGAFTLHFGALLLTPGANQGGAVATNALAVNVN